MAYSFARSIASRSVPNGARWRAVRGIVLLAVSLSCANDALDPNRDAVASVVVSPNRLNVGVGASAPLTAEVRDASGTLLVGRKVAWATKDPNVATVSGNGVVTGLRAGPVQVAATAEGKSAIVDVTVHPKAVATIRLSPSGDARLLVAEKRQMSAETLDADGAALPSRLVTWSSNAATVASVSTDGLITAVAPGDAVITAASEGKTAVVAVTVSAVPVASVTVTPSADELVVTQTLQLTAIAKDALGTVLPNRPASWVSGAPLVATVSVGGAVTAVGAGSAVIFATIDGRTGSALINVRQLPVTSVTVTPASSNIAVGASVQLDTTIRSGTTVITDRPVAWRSSNDQVAVVSSDGRVTGLKAGTVTITATCEGVSGTAFVAVGITSVVVTPSPTSVVAGATRQLTAVARDAANAPVAGVAFQWASATPATATVDGNGLVTGRVASATPVGVSASVGNVSGASAVTVTPVPVASIVVTPAAPNVVAGQTVQLTATVKDASGNVLTGRQVAWSSSNTLRATVNPTTGLVTTLVTAKGTTVTITAALDGKTGTSLVTIQ